MNRTVSLSQFMPYGAPELIAAGPRHLSRAVISSSFLAMTAFLLAFLLAPRWVPEPLRVIDVAPRNYAPPLEIMERKSPPPPPATPIRSRSMPDQGVIRPTAEPEEPPPIDPFGARSGAIEGTVRGVMTPPVAINDREEPPPERLDPIFADELPVAVIEIKPDYPSMAREAGVEGLVIVHALVGKEGRVLKAEVADKFSIPLLNDAAVEAARRWVFKPALTNNRPVAVWVALRFNFTLH